MYEQLTKSMFIDRMNEIRPDNFSYKALGLIYDYYEELENVEFDPIAICFEWTESNWEEISEYYGYPEDDPQTFLSDNTFYIESGNLVIYQAF